MSHIITVFVEFHQQYHQSKQMRDKEEENEEEEDAPIPRGKDNATRPHQGGTGGAAAAAIDEREVCLTNRKVLLYWGYKNVPICLLSVTLVVVASFLQRSTTNRQ